MSVVGISNEERVLKNDVRNTIRHRVDALTACYAGSLAGLEAASSKRGILHIEMDDTGRIKSARAEVSLPDPVARCLEGAVAGYSVDGVDTGDASADVELVFDAR